MPDNTINWGQGAVNNSNDWGKAKANSANSFGAVYDASPSGDTNLTGGSAGLAQVNNVYSMEFDGVNDVINCGNDSSLQITGAMTVSYWFKGQTGSASVGGVGKLGASGNRGFCLDCIGTITFYIAQNTTSLFSLSYSNTPDNNWHHLVGVYNPSTSVQIYLDGVLVKEQLVSIPASQYNGSNNLQIGARGDSTGFFNGSIDEVGIFNTALTDAEIQSIYNATETGKTADLNDLTTPPVAWLRMGD